MRPLWRDLVLRVWGANPLQCPCCQATMQCVGTIVRRGEIQFFSASAASGRASLTSRRHPIRPSTSTPSNPSNRRGRPSGNGFPTTMRSQAATCSTSTPTPASRSRSPAKTVPSSSSIPADATESNAPDKTASEKAWHSGGDSHASEVPDERIHFIASADQPEISFPGPRKTSHASFFIRISAFLHRSLPPDHLTPQRWSTV